MYDANVFMLHGFFPEKVQKALSLRLVGSFYTIDMVNAPAFRVFVKDAANAHVVRLAPKSGVLAEGGAEVHRQTCMTVGRRYPFLCRGAATGCSLAWRRSLKSRT